jgi:hypothetical protein
MYFDFNNEEAMWCYTCTRCQRDDVHLYLSIDRSNLKARNQALQNYKCMAMPFLYG